jgi:hypothetical protein
MPSQLEIINALKSLPEGADISTLAESLKVKAFQLTAGLAALRKKGSIVKEGEIYRVVADATATTVTPALEKPIIETPLLPNDFDAFVGLAVTCGIEANFAKAIADFIFQGDAYDLNITYERLKSLHLRQDTLSRLLSMWASAIGKPIPQKVAEATTPASTITTTSKEAKHYSVFGQQIVIDAAGPYDSVIDAQRELALRLQPAQQPGDSEGIRVLTEEVKSLREAQASQQFTMLKDLISAVNSKVDMISGDRKEASRFGVLQTGVDRVGTELSGWRSDIKSLVPQVLNQVTIRRRTEQEKARFNQGLDKGIQRAKASVEAENKLWPELDASGRQVVTAPAPEVSKPGCYNRGYVNGVIGCVDRRDDPKCAVCSFK